MQDFYLAGRSKRAVFVVPAIARTIRRGHVELHQVNVLPNDVGRRPHLEVVELAVGGHNWEFDQGSTTCKATDTAVTGAPPTGAPSGWSIPSNTTTDCFVLPVVRLLNGQITFTDFGVVPLTSQVIIPTCDPTALATAPLTPNPRNTRLNQLGCSLSRLDNGFFQGPGPDRCAGLIGHGRRQGRPVHAAPGQHPECGRGRTRRTAIWTCSLPGQASPSRRPGSP